MKTVTLDVYEYNELSDEVKTKVLDEYKETLKYYDDGVIEDITNLLECLGFSEIDIYYNVDNKFAKYARVTGKYSKRDLSFVKNNYKGEKLSQILELLEPVNVLDYDVESETLGFFYDIIELVNSMVFDIIVSDYQNYYSHGSLLDNLNSFEFLIDGTIFNQ